MASLDHTQNLCISLAGEERGKAAQELRSNLFLCGIRILFINFLKRGC